MTPTTSADIERLHRALDKRPHEQMLRLLLADAYEEAGDESAAECLRWMAKKDRHPLELKGVWPSGNWQWWNPEQYNLAEPQYNHLPPSLWYQLQNAGDESIDLAKRYRTRREAEEALFATWKVARAKGWIPE